ncbi:MAG TPA: cell division protein FtsH, partial [Planctomycetaceae bacterium]|nr:cell division protein FtsH [Planctomycetaceae bacterium]
VHKVSIIPRGRALGATQILPAEDRFSITQSEILDRLVVLLAGRAAERMVFGETTAGAENDLERATELARRMITHWGMSKTIGPVSVKLSEDDPFLGRELQRAHLVSDATLEKIDQEIRKWLIEADRQAQELLQQYRGELEQLVSALLKEEELIEAEIREILGAPLWQDESDEGEGGETDTTQTRAGESSSASPRPAARASGAVPESEMSPETTQPTERSPSQDSD